jgi:hypothetical protein
MALQYVKLANIGGFSRVVLLSGITENEIIVVNIKGRILTASEVERHLNGTLDGETVSA